MQRTESGSIPRQSADFLFFLEVERSSICDEKKKRVVWAAEEGKNSIACRGVLGSWDEEEEELTELRNITEGRET